jgi:hypothetical protein
MQRRAIVLAAAALGLFAAGCTTVPVVPAPPPPLPGPLPPPLPPPGPGPVACNASRASFALGQRASPPVLERATLASRARVARVVAPGEMVTADFRPDRLTVRVNRRNVIVDLTCG